jgi:DNA-binding transcriptional LysR family regulator
MTAKEPQPRREAPFLLRTRLKLRHLLLLVALDEDCKLSTAAARLNLSQPAASKMLGEIETLVGVPLFNRLARGVEPTEYGEVLVRRSRTILTELDLADAEIAALRDGEGGIVSIGTVTAPAVDILVDALQDLRRHAAQIRVAVEVDTSQALMQRLHASALDFIIARIPADLPASHFDYIEIAEEDCRILVRTGHPLLKHPVLGPADLAGQEWALQPLGSPLRHAVEQLLRRHGVPAPRNVVTTGSVLMSLALAARTDTLVPVSMPVAELFTNPEQFAILPLAEKLVVSAYGLIKLRDRALSPAARLCFEALCQVAEKRGQPRTPLGPTAPDPVPFGLVKTP